MVTASMFVVPLLAVAVWSDLTARRIPNPLVLLGLVLGLGLSTVHDGIDGTLDSALSALTGLAILFPFFALRLVGAGDVKLLAMIGAFHVAGETFMVAIYGMAAGGLLALGVMLHPRRGPVARANLKLFLTGAMARQGIASVARDLGEHTAARIPYGVAIAAGYAIFLAEGVLA